MVVVFCMPPPVHGTKDTEDCYDGAGIVHTGPTDWQRGRKAEKYYLNESESDDQQVATPSKPRREFEESIAW